MRSLGFLSILALASLGAGFALAVDHTVTSPDGSIVATVALDDKGTPVYRVAYRQQPLIAASKLGLKLAGGVDLSQGFELVRTERNTVNETWVQPWGEVREVTDAHHELTLVLRTQAEPRRMVRVVFRVFNDGVGFRYELPRQPHLKQIVIEDELTQFALAKPSRAWWIPAYEHLRFEYLYQNSPVEELKVVHTPLTCQTDDGTCISIHEAALVDYASMTLRRAEGQTLVADLVPWSDGVKVRGQAPLKSPWRTIQVAAKPQDLLASTLILNLNEPCKLDSTEWIKPGKYVGVWWEMHVGRSTWGSGDKHGANTANVKRFIDFADKYDFEGVLVEGWNQGWDGDWMADGRRFSFTDPYPDYDLEGLTTYARDRGVFMIAHNETSCAVQHYESKMADAFSLYEKLGIPAIKSGYVGFGQGVPRYDEDGTAYKEWHHGQFMVRHHQRVVEEAAKHHIMLFPHEPIKDSGLRRTYPNLMSREGARGQEYNAWGENGGNPPDHVVNLAYTRMLAGPMDYTPGVFDLLIKSGDRPNNRINHTLAKELALYVVLYSPFQMAVDFPEVYEKRKDAFQFVIDVPTDWETTRPLAGEIGKYLAIARRDRDSRDWYVGAITDQEPRSLHLALDFLDEDTTYVAQIYGDAKDADWRTNPLAYAIESRDVTRGDTLDVELAPGGGQAIRLTPKQ